jgi:Cys-tRNA(Pro) deacylase
VSSEQVPTTLATRALKAAGVAFVPRLYRYEERGGTAVSSRELGVDEHAVIKTLVMETDTKAPLIVLMHGDREVSTKNLARAIGCKTVTPCKPEVADRHSGYHVGGTSPFGTKKKMPVYVERTILELPRIFINGGHKGFLVEMDPKDLGRVVDVTPVDAAQNLTGGEPV